MSQEEQEEQHPCKEAQFVNDNRAHLIERVTSVMPLADVLRSKDMIHEEKYSKIKAEKTDPNKMRTLFEALHAGGDVVKTAFYHALRKHEPRLFMDLGGENRKRKLSDSECQVETKYKKPNTENERQINNSFVTLAPQYNVTIVQDQKPVPTTVFLNSPIKPPFKSPGVPPWFPAIKTERKTPALKKKTPATKKEKKPPATKKEKKPPATQKEKKPPATKKEKKPPATKKEKKPPATQKEKKPPATQKEKKPPATQKEKKPPTPKKVKKPPAPKKVRNPPAPKKEKSPAPKKEKKPPAPKEKKPPAPKEKKPPAPKKEKKPLAPKK